ncbi:MAG TPA: aminopeptidase [Longimicrobiales bacterium]|nr:aminopeptidase [Longimicrobiales bacterium]
MTRPARCPPPRRLRRAALLAFALALVAGAWACSPIYVIKAGIAEAKILRARRPIPQVIADPETDDDTRGKLSFVMEARRFAIDELGIDVGDAYTMYTKLDRDTLALVVSAAEKDRLAARTWWFPIVGRVPYKGYFDEKDAREAVADLEADGFDTYLRPTAAFSTLGWFNDPILSTVLRADDVEVVETVLHELSHNHLFVPGHVGFNESYATFVGRTAAIRFFCSRQGGGPDTVKCLRAQARWRDFQRFSVFVDGLVDELEAVYGDAALTRDEKLERRGRVFAAALERFDRDVAPGFESMTFAGFRETPLNNATLLARIRYYHRLPDFDALLAARGGDLAVLLRELKEGAGVVEDPFELLDPARRTP